MVQTSHNRTDPPEWVSTAPPSAPPDVLDEFEPVYLEPGQLQFRYDGETLTLRVSDGAFYPRVTLRRCFPLSSQDEYVTVRGRDEEDADKETEIGIIRDVSQLNPQSSVAVTRELRLHYLVPVIQRILEIREEFGFLHWKAETDRGPKDFTMRDSPISAVREVAAGRLLLIDINKARYEIRDQGSLDSSSQELLKRHLLL